MAAVRRRPRGSLQDPVALGYVIERTAKTRIDTMAVKGGITAAAMLQLVIEHVELTDAGVPTWYRDESQTEELPISPD